MMNVSGGGYGQQRAERREQTAEAVGGRRAMHRNGNPRVSVVVPTRNEARNLEVVLPAIAAVRPAVHEIIIVDGNSVDGTIETAQRVLPWVKTISQTRKGKGNAMACGFAAATGDVIVMFDADGSADPAEIPAFVRALIDGADFAKGSRFVRGGGSDDITLLRKSGNAGLNGVANALFGTSYTDLCYGYNAFWIDILPTLDLPDIHLPAPPDGMLWGDGFEIETVLNCRVAASGLKITEVPSMERDRIFGQSNLRTFADGTRVLRTLAAERRRAQHHRSERVKLEESSRALTPPGGFPAITPEVLAAADGAESRYPLGQSDGSRRGLAFMEEEAS
jgi:glycosyl transferase family 2